MSDPTAIVSVITGIGTSESLQLAAGDVPGVPESAPVPTIQFANGEAAYLNPLDPRSNDWQPMLSHLREAGRPAYVELAAGTRTVRRALIPRVGRIVKVTEVTADTFNVQLEASAAVHVAKASTPGQRTMLERLQQSSGTNQALVVTAGPEDRVILDVREPEHPVPVRLPCPDGTREHRLISNASLVAHPVAANFFQQLLAQQCQLPAVAGDCLPFQYPDDFCWAVASRICKLLAQAGYQAGKAWLFGDLQLKTRNRSGCVQPWHFHVAAFVRVKNTTNLHDLLIIDPASFAETGPVLYPAWRDELGGTDEGVIITDNRTYRLAGRDNGLCELEGETEDDLTSMRDELRSRAQGRTAPPPYAECLATPDGKAVA